MDIGFVGTEHELRRFEAGLASHPPHRLRAVLLDPVSTAPIPASATRCADLDGLLSIAQLDAVILGGPVAARADRLKRVVQLGRHCLALHPVALDAITYHEVALIAVDHRVTIVPCLPARLHPAWRQLHEAVSAVRPGAVRDVLVERAAPQQSGRELVAGAYAEAADLAAALAGSISEVTATGDLADRRLVVLHRSDAGTNAEVRLVPAHAMPYSWRIRVVAAGSARAELTVAGDGSDEATLVCDESGPRRVPVDRSAEAAAIAELERAVRGEPCQTTWSQATRAAELAQAAWLSLERRRSVDVYHEDRSELTSFKGRMTSFGCGLIWFTIAMLILIAAGKGLAVPGSDWLAVLLVVVWIAFLGLQGLRWILPAPDRSTEPAQKPDE